MHISHTCNLCHNIKALVISIEGEILLLNLLSVLGFTQRKLVQRCEIAGSLDGRYNWCQKWDAEMSTRASAKQQELEEQLAKLLCMMELQQQRQEQLAREQQQRQEEEFGRLLEEQQQQLGKLLMKQQREAEERIGALKDNLRQTKTAIEGRFQATEESLEGMHRELASGCGCKRIRSLCGQSYRRSCGLNSGICRDP